MKKMMKSALMFKMQSKGALCFAILKRRAHYCQTKRENEPHFRGRLLFKVFQAMKRKVTNNRRMTESLTQREKKIMFSIFASLYHYADMKKRNKIKVKNYLT
jgi:uncharacterized protein (DUF2141 family)